MGKAINAVKLIEVIKNNMEALQAAGEKAYKEAMYNTHLEFRIAINEDGEINEWYTNAGSNSTTQECFNGEAINVIKICKQYAEFEVTTNDIYEKLEEKGIDLEEVKQEAEEAEQNLHEYMTDHYLELMQEIEEEHRQFDISEYGPQEIEYKIDQTLYYLESTL